MVFRNVYEIITSPRIIKKQWFVDYFDGDTPRSWWHRTNDSGSSTFSMVDAVNEGVRLTTGTSTSEFINIAFNNKRQYNHKGSVMILSIKRLTNTTTTIIQSGLMELQADATDTFMRYSESNTGSFKVFATGDGSSTGISTDVPIDNEWTHYKVELQLTTGLGYISNILKTTHTLNLPNVRLQPKLGRFVGFTSGAARTFRMRYCEVYNT